MTRFITKKVALSILVAAVAGSLYLAYYLDLYTKVRFCETEVIELNGYSLSAMTCGNKKPTVIIEGGLACNKEEYFALQKRIFPDAKVITYDHAGIGESTISGNPRTLPFYIQELKAMLTRKGLEPPYIFIGHSFGGHIIRYFTDFYPKEVAGLVFLDAPHEDWFRHIRANWTVEEQEQYFRWWNPEITSQDQIVGIERVEYDRNGDLIRDKVIPSNIPVLMFTGYNVGHFRKDAIGRVEDWRVWAQMQSSILFNVESAKQIIDSNSGHWPTRDKPEEVAREVRDFIHKIQNSM